MLDLQPVELLLAELGRVRRTDEEDDRALIELFRDQRIAVGVRSSPINRWQGWLGRVLALL